MPVRPKTLVVGAGYVGQRFLSRQPEDPAASISRSSGVDLDDEHVTIEVPAGQYAVLYTVPPSQQSSTDVRLERLLARLDPPPVRIAYISTTGVYGDCAGALVDETRAVNPQNGRARLRVAAEQALQNWCDEHGVTSVILRVPGIYGPTRLGIERLRSGAANIDEAEANPGNRIHVDDLVRCCEAALAGKTPGGIYNVGDGDYRSATWFQSELARQCDLPAPPTISRAAAEKEFSAMRLSFLGESRRIDTRKMRELLDVTPRYENPAEGIVASLEEEAT